MALQSNIELINILKSLVPISNLSRDNIELISGHAELRKVEEDGIIFSEGDSDEYVYYLLQGELELISTNSTNFHIVAGTDGARYPLAQFQPRQYTAKAVHDSIVLLVDRNLLDSLLVGNSSDNSDANNGVEVNDIDSDENDDWMTRILQSPLYTSISVENIQKIFSRIESIDVNKGDVIISQGEEGDYYYIIQIGRCQISRKPSAKSQDINLAELREGDAFGEEAIIANLKRNASVKMLSDGRLMRLNKSDFRELILEPILQVINFESATDKVKQGVVWLDVRYPDEYQDFSTESSINIPLNLLRLQLGKLDNEKQYITCCDTGSRSSIAAYILAQHGYKVFQLEAGLKSIVTNNEHKRSESNDSNDKANSADILPFKKDIEVEQDINNIHMLNDEFKSEIDLLRQELGLVKEQLQDLMHIKTIASDLKKSVIDATEKRLKNQQDKINLQTQSVNKLVQQTHKMRDNIEEEKGYIYKELKKNSQEQEQRILGIKQEINERFHIEEKKVHDFYTWKADVIENIKKMKEDSEKKYLALKIEQNMTNTDINIQNKVKVEPIEKNDDQTVNQKDMLDSDLKQWVLEQTANGLSPVNREIENEKRKIVEKANIRAEKSRQISKVHDKALASEIDALLKHSEK